MSKKMTISTRSIMKNINMKIVLRNAKEFKIRIWIGCSLIRLATKIMGVGSLLVECKGKT